MKKKLAACVLSLALAATVFAGCGSSGSTDSGSTTTADGGSDAADGGSDAAGGDAQYQVGIVQLVQHEALDAASEGFTQALYDELGEENVSVDLQVAAGESTECTTIVNQFVSGNYDLIMANATAALQSAAQGTADIPVVGTSITEYGVALDMELNEDGTTGTNVTGYSDLAPLDEQADMLAEWCPAADYPNVGIIYCSAEPNSEFQATTISGYLEEKGYAVKTYTFADSNDIASVATTACADSDVIYIPTDNTAASCTDIIREIALPENGEGTPIIAGEEGILNGCGIATLTISYYDMGYQAGVMAAQILSGEKAPETTPISYVTDFTKKYNPANCESLGLTPLEGYEAVE